MSLINPNPFPVSIDETGVSIYGPNKLTEPELPEIGRALFTKGNSDRHFDPNDIWRGLNVLFNRRHTGRLFIYPMCLCHVEQFARQVYWLESLSHDRSKNTFEPPYSPLVQILG